MPRSLKIFLVAAVGCIGSMLPICAEEPLLLSNQQRMKAELISVDKDGTLHFRSGEQARSIGLQDLVRWSFPPQNLESQEVILVDGSRLVLAELWSGQDSLRFEADAFYLQTKFLGEIHLPRAAIRVILLNGPVTSLERTQFLDGLTEYRSEHDRLLLTNGDVLIGELIGMTSSTSSETTAVAFTLDQQSQPLTFPSDQVAAIVIGIEKKLISRDKLAVGLRDGSYLKVQSLVANENEWRAQLTAGIQVQGDSLSDILHLQSFATETTYLSDLPLAKYQQQSYLEIPWAYRRDRNVLGGRLSVDGNVYAKGLGVYTHSLLTFEIPQNISEVTTPESNHRYQRFAAEIAVDDAAESLGSVIFQVYLVKDGAMQLAYTSPTLRGGDEPMPVSVELGDAEQLVLAADYADRGDEGDYANWLDARLE